MDGDVDWRRELLQAVRSVFDSEREWLHAQLQDVMATNTGIDYTALLKHLESLLQKQVLKYCLLFVISLRVQHSLSLCFHDGVSLSLAIRRSSRGGLWSSC